MKDLDRNEVYDLRGAREEQLTELIEWLGKQQESWIGYPVVNLQRADYIRCCSGWWCHGTEEEPTIHISTLFEEEFKLPERWCIKVKGNRKTLENWRAHGCNSLIDDIGYLCEDKIWRSKPISGRTEITFEQFEKYVLNKKQIMEKPKLTITRQALSEIYGKVCYTWQKNIENILNSSLFRDDFEVPEHLVKNAYSACVMEEQMEWLEKYFPQPEKMKLQGYYSMFTGSTSFETFTLSPHNKSTWNLIYSTEHFDIIEEVTIEGDKRLYIGKYNEGRI